ncbi:integrase [Pseudomonas sp. SIMBA_041]|uniref:integrase n=1 Tax=Pseudomonas sp. SIMBA_041 TaxID=3085782 RepID=UPI00397C9F41
MSSVVASIGNLFASGEFLASCEPDNALHLYSKPTLDFVLCRDQNGKATAIYGGSVWNFNPYRLSANKINKIHFDSVFIDFGEEECVLIEEAKYLLYCLIYFGGGGRIGSISAATLIQYWVQVVRRAMQFCLAQREKPIVGVLSLQQLFTVPVYLASFIREKVNDGKVLSAILSQLVRVGEQRLGYAVLNPSSLSLTRPEYKQHPVIPTRIYLNLINVTGDILDRLYNGSNSLDCFIASFGDEHYGINVGVQRARGLGGRVHYRPDMSQAIMDHGLKMVFSEEFACPFRKNLQRVLLKMQYVAKSVIHLYTGMREQEVMRMPFNCLSEQVVRQPVFDDQKILRDKSQTISVLSTTTKYAGYKKSGAWLAPSEVIKAVEVARAICRGLAKLYDVELDDRCPLFLNPSIVSKFRNGKEVAVTSFPSTKTHLDSFKSLTIQEADLAELAQSDSGRDFHSELAFAVGQPWPLSSHQFRRSLAFYGSSSGFVSLPTLRAQYKHMTIQMARYYANGFDKLRTIFGYYDEKKKDFMLPKNHIAFEFQMAMPMSVANELISDLLFREEPLFGGTGSYMEKQKKSFFVGEINIEDVRSDTERRVKNGAISYRPTLLGGCTKVGRCNSFLLGDYSECLSCEGAIIKPEMLNFAIEDATEEASHYAENSGEYQIVKSEISRLLAFKASLIAAVEI